MGEEANKTYDIENMEEFSEETRKREDYQGLVDIVAQMYIHDGMHLENLHFTNKPSEEFMRGLINDSRIKAEEIINSTNREEICRNLTDEERKEVLMYCGIYHLEGRHFFEQFRNALWIQPEAWTKLDKKDRDLMSAFSLSRTIKFNLIDNFSSNLTEGEKNELIGLIQFSDYSDFENFVSNPNFLPDAYRKLNPEDQEMFLEFLRTARFRENDRANDTGNTKNQKVKEDKLNTQIGESLENQKDEISIEQLEEILASTQRENESKTNILNQLTRRASLILSIREAQKEGKDLDIKIEEARRNLSSITNDIR